MMFAPANVRKHNAWLPPSNAGHVEYVSRTVPVIITVSPLTMDHLDVV